MRIKYFFQKSSFGLFIFILFHSATIISTKNILNILNNNAKEKIEGYPEDAFLHTSELIEKYGYKSETHSIVTEDGYFITLQRIPSSNPPVVLFNGLFGSSREFLLPLTGSSKDSLGMMLADAGYDVWFFNTRGNRYSVGHVNTSEYSSEYWDFGMDEQSYYDIPAAIDYVLDVTKYKKINYVAISMGTIMFFQTMSARPEFNDKVNLFIGLAPGLSLGSSSSPFFTYFTRFISPEEPLKSVLNLVGKGKLLPNIYLPLFNYMWHFLCVPRRNFCENAFYLFSGYSPGKVLPSAIDMASGLFPNPTSVRTIIQLLQYIKYNSTSHYDFGMVKNLKIYKSPHPPKYNMSLVTAPLAFYSGMTDSVISPKDTDLIAGQLQNNIVENVRVNWPKPWAHADFLLAYDAPEILYKRIITLLKKFNNFNEIPS